MKTRINNALIALDEAAALLDSAIKSLHSEPEEQDKIIEADCKIAEAKSDLINLISSQYINTPNGVK